jgi:hypothetical protein
MCFVRLDSENWATLIGALIGIAATVIGVFVHAYITDRKDRESRLRAFRAFLFKWRKMLAREVERGLRNNETMSQTTETICWSSRGKLCLWNETLHGRAERHSAN